ncbi:hypothetical protein [Nocardia alni]|uniref:aromatic-ring hydroxylase C-terminal domain-containing protein n=1 Tax=Nocardia alni TaxID=2815723 RepID=UPI001C2276DA|nr:hypothetical protein [Nocardia alni]
MVEERVQLFIAGGDTPGIQLPRHRLAPGVSTLDLVRSHYVLIGGSHRWIAAAADAAAELHIPLDSHAIPLSDNAHRPWADEVGIAPDGAVLVRPDGTIAARILTMPPAPARLLRYILTEILARE